MTRSSRTRRRRIAPLVLAVAAALLSRAATVRAQDLTIAPPVVTVAGVTNLATVSWTPATRAMGYLVMRREIVPGNTSTSVVSATPWVQVGSLGVLSLVDVVPKPSMWYEYRVDAVSRGSSLQSVPARIYMGDFTTPTISAPTGVGDRVTVTWSAAAGVSGYIVRRQTLRSDGTSTDLAQLTPAPIAELTYTDVVPQRGVAYEYQVASVSPSGSAASRWSKYYVPPAPVPPIVTVLATADRSTISWTATTGAAAYNVERVQLDAAGRPVGPPMLVGRRMHPGPTITDGALAPSTTYQYTVSAVFQDMTTMPSRVVDFTVPAYRTPGNVIVAGGGGRVGISWCAAAGVTGYLVHRRTVRTDGSVVDALQRTPQPIPATTFIDDLPMPGLIYEYQVVSIAADYTATPAPWVRYQAGAW